jgi:chromate transporter
MLLPGPEAQQLATYVGWLLHGVKGGLIAGALFVAPGALVVLALSWLYIEHGTAPLVEAAFFGVRAAVVAFVVEALIRISKRALKSRVDYWIAIASFAALTLFAVPFPLIIVAAALIGAFALKRKPSAKPEELAAPAAQPSTTKALQAALLWGFAWLAPLAATFAALGPDHVLSRVGALFAKLAVVTFGGAYAVLSYLRQQAVEVEGWLSPEQMIDGLGLAETTPGPLVLFRETSAQATPWGTRIDLPELLSFDVFAFAICIATAIALIRFHVNAIIVVVAAAVVGMATAFI